MLSSLVTASYIDHDGLVCLQELRGREPRGDEREGASPRGQHL